MLTRYWFEFENPPNGTALNLGCGVTAYNYDDAVSLLHERVFGEVEFRIVKYIEDIDIRTLDEKHILPNIGLVPVRGIWFPLGYSAGIISGQRNNMPIGFQPIGIRSKYRLSLLVFFANWVGFGFLALYINPLLCIPVFLVVFACGFYSMNLKCRICNKPVLYNPVNNFGIKMYVYTPTIPEKCTRCGTPIT